uniref:Uncharacterized protein n=1 Tax=Chromera velia CCMP2878 TaxID=1169474 RepID=A0A0G4HBA4_9ALVE|eukprot:Cvel_926.t1-p1 / transcript=Cvel_926.t1 / gene=Cvel_926 / organism=Chromera_velia_CCMP2878 / gene_product=hypothetical protein / transcript_product=hypothetical protein / location=Cvel_scaffold29:109775-112847(+) / protein_length=455 / sequence_SO=supercontig / SO=protein_coding / is_pseudo=false
MADENRTPVSSQKQQSSFHRQRPTLADLLGKGSQKQRNGIQEKEPHPPRYTETGGFARFKAGFKNYKEAKQRWVVRYLSINLDTAEADAAAEVLDELDTRLRHDLVECTEEDDSFFDVVQRVRESGGPGNVIPFEEQWEFILRHYETSQIKFGYEPDPFLKFAVLVWGLREEEQQSIYKDLRDETDFDEVIALVKALVKAQATSFGQRKDEDDKGVMETGPLKAVLKKAVKGGEKTEEREERAAKGRSAGSGEKSDDSDDNTESGVKPIFKFIPDRLAKRCMRCVEEGDHQASCSYSDDTIARKFRYEPDPFSKFAVLVWGLREEEQQSIYKDLRDETDFDEVIALVEALVKAQATSFGKKKDEDDTVMETGPLKAVLKNAVKGGKKTEEREERAAKGRSAGLGEKSKDSDDDTESGVKPIFKSIPDRLAKRCMRCVEEGHHQASCSYSDDTIVR